MAYGLRVRCEHVDRGLGLVQVILRWKLKCGLRVCWIHVLAIGGLRFLGIRAEIRDIGIRHYRFKMERVRRTVVCLICRLHLLELKLRDRSFLPGI